VKNQRVGGGGQEEFQHAKTTGKEIKVGGWLGGISKILGVTCREIKRLVRV